MRRKTIFMIFISIFYLVSFAFSTWKIIGMKDVNIANKPAVAVAYILESPDVKYTSIEKALEVANSNIANGSTSQNVIVITNTNPTINKDCSINNGVTLILPHSWTNETTYEYDNREGVNATFADGFKP